jgi:hypothetical protein
MPNRESNIQIIVAEFDGPEELLDAARLVSRAGYTRFDCHSPFPINGMNSAMGVRRSRLGFIVGAFAAIGLLGAYYMQVWMSSVDYPVIISGKPFNSFQAFVPVTFALTVLLSAFAAFLGSLMLNRLPRYHHPLFDSENFARVTDDGFFLSIESSDPKFDPRRTREFLQSIGGKRLEVLEA